MSHEIVISKDNGLQSLDDRDHMSKGLNVSAVRSIMDVMLCTHPDVSSYVLNMTSGYQSDLGEGLWTLVKNNFKYLKRTKYSFLVYGGDEKLVVKCYTITSFK